MSCCSNTGSIRDDSYWTSRKNSLDKGTIGLKISVGHGNLSHAFVKLSDVSRKAPDIPDMNNLKHIGKVLEGGGGEEGEIQEGVVGTREGKEVNRIKIGLIIPSSKFSLN